MPQLRSRSVELASGSPERVISLVRRAAARQGSLPFDVVPTLDMPARHALDLQDVDPRRLESVLLTTYERAPQDFETLLGMEGVGARTLRALALVSDVRKEHRTEGRGYVGSAV